MTARVLHLYSGMEIPTCEGYVRVVEKHFDDFYCEDITTETNEDGAESTRSVYCYYTANEIRHMVEDATRVPYGSVVYDEDTATA